MTERIVVALGGNALLVRGEAPDAATQRGHLVAAARSLAGLTAGHEVVVVHGNGPQVGMLAVESESDPSLARPYPLGDLVAESQGLIGSWVAQELAAVGGGPVVALVTHVLVDEADPAFGKPSKFVGATYDEATAARLARRHAWTIARDGVAWRRVVASPRPLDVMELPFAERLVGSGTTVVLAGGGGIPVVRRGPGRWETVEAVVDKDYSAALVADRLGADLLVILTDVDGVMTGFGTERQSLLRQVSADELGELELPAGSMGPKAEAACSFVRGAPHRRAAIGALSAAAQVVDGSAGTQVRN